MIRIWGAVAAIAIPIASAARDTIAVGAPYETDIEWPHPQETWTTDLVPPLPRSRKPYPVFPAKLEPYERPENFNGLIVDQVVHERPLPPLEKKRPDRYYRLIPVEQRPANRVPCAEALATDPLPQGKRAIDEILGFAEIFGRIIENSDCRREQILEYVTDLGAKRDKSSFRAEDETIEYFLLNTSLNPWYLFWWPEFRVILAFDSDGNLTYSGWSRHG